LLLAEKWPEMVIKWHFMSCNFSFFFLTKLQKRKQNKIVIFVIAFDPIKIFVDWAHQNDHQNLSFVGVINVVGDKMTGNGRKMSNS
jgi:hypothetical protein